MEVATRAARTTMAMAGGWMDLAWVVLEGFYGGITMQCELMMESLVF